MNAGISVSRVGGAAQIPAMKKNAGSLRLELAQFRELQAFAQFGSDLDKATQRALGRGERLTEILKQGQYAPVPVEDQVMILYAGTSGGIDELAVSKVQAFEKAFLEHMADTHPEVGQGIVSSGKVSDEAKATMDEAIKVVVTQLG